jgi:hypothetical protein
MILKSGVDERCVTDFEIRENASLNKQDFHAYISGRASRNLRLISRLESINGVQKMKNGLE